MIFHLAVVVRQSVRIFIKREPFGKAHRRRPRGESCMFEKRAGAVVVYLLDAVSRMLQSDSFKCHCLPPNGFAGIAELPTMLRE